MKIKRDAIDADIAHEVHIDDDAFEELTGIEMTGEQWEMFSTLLCKMKDAAVNRIVHTLRQVGVEVQD